MIPTVRCGSYNIRIKFNIDPDEKKAEIPRLIWNDGHQGWIRQPWFKDGCDRIGRGQVSFR